MLQEIGFVTLHCAVSISTCRASRGWYIWHMVHERWSLCFYRNAASSQISMREMLWKNHPIPFGNADFNELKALYSRQEIFADFLWFRTTKWSWAWGLWMAKGIPPLRRSYWVQAMKTPARTLEDLCWPIRCVHQGQHLECQDWLQQTQGVSEVKRYCFLRRICSKRLASARGLNLNKKFVF